MSFSLGNDPQFAALMEEKRKLEATRLRFVFIIFLFGLLYVSCMFIVDGKLHLLMHSSGPTKYFIYK